MFPQAVFNTQNKQKTDSSVSTTNSATALQET